MNGDANTGAGQPQAGTSGEPPAGAAATGQAPAANTGQAPAAGAQQGTDGAAGAGAAPTETADEKAARLERENAELRKEAAGYRTKASNLERQQQAAAQAGMSEAEKAAQRTAQLEQQNAELLANLKAQAVRAATTSAATRLNYRNPDLAHRLIDQGDLEFDEATGEPKNAEKLLRELAAREPYLLKSAGQDYGGGNRGGQPDGQPGMNELLRAALGKS